MKLDTGDLIEKMEVLPAIQLLLAAWRDDVKVSTIRNCWVHTGLLAAEDLIPEEDLHEAGAEIRANLVRMHNSNAMDIDNFLNPAEEDAPPIALNDEELLQRVRESFQLPADGSDHAADNAAGDDDDDAGDDSHEVPFVSASDGLSALTKLEALATRLGCAANPGIMRAIDELGGLISEAAKQTRQSSIMQYFHPQPDEEPQ